jgi:glycosyltransferase involved in cell wall biosynthesis
MIVKNEAANLSRLFNSVKDFIDYFVIVDTGSTDNTKEVIESFKDIVPGELHEMDWVNFGWNRSESIKLTKGKTDYVLLLDGDDTINIKDIKSFKDSLSGDGYHIHHTGSLDYTLPRLITSAHDWRFVGVTHEYITSPQGSNFKDQRELTITHHADGGCRSDKFTRDIQLLEQGLIDEPDNARYVFYLAQSYKDVGQWDKAFEAYKKRASMGGWPEEVYYCYYQMVNAQIYLSKQGVNTEGAMLEYLMKGIEVNPERVEALYAVIRHYRTTQQYTKAMVYARHGLMISYPYNQKLFIEKDIYDWKLLDEISICQYWVGDYWECRSNCKKLLTSGLLPTSEMKRVQSHIEFCETNLKK